MGMYQPHCNMKHNEENSISFSLFEYVFVDTLNLPRSSLPKFATKKKKTLQPCDVLLVAQDLSVQTLQHLVLCANCQPCRQQIRKSNQRLPCGCCSVGLPGASWIQIRQVETCLFLDDFLRKILLEYLFLLEFIPTLHCNIET